MPFFSVALRLHFTRLFSLPHCIFGWLRTASVLTVSAIYNVVHLVGITTLLYLVLSAIEHVPHPATSQGKFVRN